MQNPVKLYATIVGAVVFLLGVLGLILGEGHLFGLLNIDIVEDIVHLVTGALLLYVGLAPGDIGLARTVVGVLGVIYLLVGIVGFVDDNLFGLLPGANGVGYTIYDNIVHLLLGVLGIVVGWFLPRTTTVTT